MSFLDRAEQFLRYAGPGPSSGPGSGPSSSPGSSSGPGSVLGDGSVLDAEMPDSEGVPPEVVLRALPEVARTAAGMLWRTSRWTLNATVRVGNIMVAGTVTGQSADALAGAVLSEVRHSLRLLTGAGEEDTVEISLAERMSALLDASADVGGEEGEGAHPAYARLLSELTPDEARILRLFAQHGPQPAVDVRTRKLLGGGSRLVAPALTMIGRYAGCHNAARVPGYLDNMSRLGLIRVSDDALGDQRGYDVLEAQQEVKEALTAAGRGITMRRSIELTVFGRNLCTMTGLLPAEPHG